MKTSCVILNYNDYQTTLSLLESIKYYKVFDYIVLVDNCSTDNSFEVLNEYQNDKIKVIKTDYNGGYGYGNNCGINYAYKKLNSDYILIVNPDVEFKEECVRTIRNVLKNNKDVAVCSAIPRQPDGNNQSNIAWCVPNVTEYILSASIIYNKFFNNMYYKDSYYKRIANPCNVDCVAGSFLMVNAELMIKNGMYDESVFLYGEELILGIKLKNKKLRTVLLLDQYYIHHHSISINKIFSSRLDKQKLQLKSKLIILKKYYNVSSVKMKLIKTFFKLSIIEYMIITTLNNIFKYRIKSV